MCLHHISTMLKAARLGSTCWAHGDLGRSLACCCLPGIQKKRGIVSALNRLGGGFGKKWARHHPVTSEENAQFLIFYLFQG